MYEVPRFAGRGAKDRSRAREVSQTGQGWVGAPGSRVRVLFTPSSLRPTRPARAAAAPGGSGHQLLIKNEFAD